MKKIYLVVLLSLLAFVSCSKDDEQLTSQEAATGKVLGKVVTNNETAVARALVFHDQNGEISFTYTDTNGNFELTIPKGVGNLHIQTGNGKLFRTVTEISIEKDEVLDLTGNSSLRLTQQANLGYLAGAFDSIQDMVVEMGYAISEVTITDLASTDLHTQYDAIFLNCDLATFDDATSTNMINYVSQGGSLYSSDWGIGYYLGADNGTGTDCGDRPGGFIDDSTICTEKIEAERPALYDSPVLSSEYQTVLGKNAMDIDSGIWTIVHDIDANFWEVLVEDTTGTPLVIRTNNVGNSVAPVNNTDADWVTICHIPPGNPNNPITITVSANAAAAHLAHGDSLGSCTDAQSGSIYYTTFENHQSGPSAIEDVKKILEHIILSL